MNRVIGRAIDHWRASSAPVRPPASESEIRSTFAAIDFPLTEDVRILYSFADGFDDLDQDSCFWWWPLSRVREENQCAERDPTFLWFADYLICSSVFCLKANDVTVSSVWIDRNHPWMGDGGGGPIRSMMTAWQHFIGRIRYGPISVEKGPRFEKKADTVGEFVEKLLQNPNDAAPEILW